MDDKDHGTKNGAPPPTVSEAPKKKSRLHWDEENLLNNAAEMEKAGPRMKIDEPKTPFAGSETGSSTSGSAHQSPPESPSFIPGEHLVGFQTLEQGIGRGSTNTPSESASSVGSAGRSVQISDENIVSVGSSPRSREEFNARRRAHYRNEAKWMEEWRRNACEEDGVNDQTGSNSMVPNLVDVGAERLSDDSDGNTADDESEEHGNDSGAVEVANTNDVHHKDSAMNGHKGDATANDEDG